MTSMGLPAMILTKDEIKTITLNAKFVHKYADQVFFASELNNAAQRIGDQPFLNFFVRYHHRNAPEKYSWSRVRRVVLLEDAIAEAQRSGAAPPASVATVEWRGKTIWVCLAVEPVNSTVNLSSSSPCSASVNAAESKEELVMLTQLSNTVPEDEEVLAFCVASANQRPTEKYKDGVLDDAPVAPPVLPDVFAPVTAAATVAAQTTPTATVVDAEGNGIAIPADPVNSGVALASLNPRLFVPTPRQVELLRQYKKQHFTHHQWSEEEIQQSKVLRQRYSGIGVAAAPVRTVAFVHEHRVVERRQQRSTLSGSAVPASPVATLLEEAEVTQDPLSGSMTQSSGAAEKSAYAMSQTPPPSSPSLMINDAPVSPFLPRSVLRQQHQYRQRISPPSMTAFANRVPSDDLLGVSQTPPPPLMPDTHDKSNNSPKDVSGRSMANSQQPDSLSELSQHLSQLRAAEDSFFKYISDEKRSHYLNLLANITLRNSETNAQNRRRGIANERRLERKGNLLESRGLWITDDKERAKQAEDYVKASITGSSDAKKKEDKSAAKAAEAGGAAGESSGPARSTEDAFVEKFKAYHDAQRISFADCADDLLSGADVDVEMIVQAAEVAENLNRNSGVSNANNAANGASSSDALSTARTNRRAVRRLLPNRLNTEEGTPLSVQAQLVHRSTIRMAKRTRDE